jgi:uncharacterized glyoxalase superfamily protein PhnB
MKLNKLGVHIKVKDFERSLKFYLAFEFKPIFIYGSSELLNQFSDISQASEKYNGITFEVGNALLEIANGHVAIKSEVFQEVINSSKISLMIDVDSVAEVRKICEENDFEIAKAEVDYPWGTREIVVRDPDGVILVFREIRASYKL